MTIQIESKRIYEPYSPRDGFRILIDRLWPRGISKEKAHIDLWFKEIAPSNELRKWYNHDEVKFIAFKKRYVAELDENKNLVELFLKELKTKKITLLFAGKESDINHVVVLKEYLNKTVKKLKR